MLIIKPLSWLFRGVGIAPSRSRLDKYISLVVITVTSVISVNVFTNILIGWGSMFEVLLIITFGTIVLGINSFLFYNAFRKESYLSIVRDLQNSENELRLIGARPQVPINMQYLSLCALLITVLIRGALSALISRSALQMSNEVILSSLIMIALIQHLVLVRLLHSMFSALNDQLRRFSAAADDTPVGVMSSQMQSVYRIHTSLHVTVTDVNGHFFVYNLLTTASRFVAFVLNMYGFFISVSEDKPLNIRMIIIFAFEMIQVIMQCVLCHACAKEANLTVLLAHYTLQPHTPHRLWLEVGEFSGTCLDNRVHFTVGEVFNLDRPLITKMFVLALSYLVVAVQLQDVQMFDVQNPLSTSTYDTTAANLTHFENLTADY